MPIPGSSAFAPNLAIPLGAPPPPPQAFDPLANDFGTDLLFFDGELQLTAKRDYAEISGVENLRRSVLRRLTTSPGEYRLDPTYGVGIGQYVKKQLTTAILYQLRHAIVDNLSRDRRIDRSDVVVTPRTFSAQNGSLISGLEVTVSVTAKGRTIALQPYNFVASAF